MKALELLRRTLRDSLALWRLAPWIVAIAVLTEFAQHVAEIDLGMFASKEAAKALENHPLRWQFGYLKIAGLALAWFLTIAFWVWRSGGRPLWRRFGLALALNGAVFLIPLATAKVLQDPALFAVNAFFSIATLPLLPFLLGAMFGDSAMTLERSYRSGWWIVLRMVLLSALGYAVLMGVHILNHQLAFGAPGPLVWALMSWDSLVVGMIAAWMGTALYHGYRGTAAPGS